MSIINRLSSQDPSFSKQLDTLLAYDASDDAAIEAATADILQTVKKHGDAAVLDYTKQFDHVAAQSLAELEIPSSQCQEALDNLPKNQRDALQFAAQRIRQYHERQKGSDWSYTEDDGTVLGQKVTPLDRVGIYVPGGKAAYPSSVLMNAIPAQVAGVSDIIMVTPTPNGEHNSLVLAAAAVAGVYKVWVIGGPHAVYIMCDGNESGKHDYPY